MRKTNMLNKNTKRRIYESIMEDVSKMLYKHLYEGRIPQYDEPVFIECSSIRDAEMKVEIGFSDYASSLFYVGDCFGDPSNALTLIADWLDLNDILDSYTGDPDVIKEYPEDYIAVDYDGGVAYFPSWLVHITDI